ncbi:MAG: hypothetical protein Q9200_002847, partial [Gallowayella weberi]
HLKPQSGRFEQIELDLEPRCDDGTLPENATIRRWYEALKSATQLFNRPIAYNHATPQMLAAQGFVDVEHRAIRVPLSTWPTGAAMTERRLADFYALALLDDRGLESYSLGPLTRWPVSWPVEDVERYCEETANEIRNRNFHMYHVMHIITARKPKTDLEGRSKDPSYPEKTPTSHRTASLVVPSRGAEKHGIVLLQQEIAAYLRMHGLLLRISSANKGERFDSAVCNGAAPAPSHARSLYIWLSITPTSFGLSQSNDGLAD